MITLNYFVVPKDTILVDVCCNPIHTNWMVALQENSNLRTLMRELSFEGILDKIKITLLIEDYGTVRKIKFFQTSNEDWFLIISGISNNRKVTRYKIDQNSYYLYIDGDLKKVEQNENVSVYEWCDNSKRRHVGNLINIENQIEFFDFGKTYFEPQSYLNIMQDFFAPKVNQEIYQAKRYSPNGKFLMINQFIKKLNIPYVRTIVQDSIIKKEIMSVDTLLCTGVFDNLKFSGVGFAPDSASLIFFGDFDSYKIVLIDSKDQKVLSEVESLAFDTLGTASLIRYACQECEKNGEVIVYEGDFLHTMLIEWSKKSLPMLAFLQKCLPMKVIKKVFISNKF